MSAGLQIPTDIDTPRTYFSGYFVDLGWGGKGNVLVKQPSVWDTILELYEMSPKINYFDLAF